MPPLLVPRADAEARDKSRFKDHRPFGDSDERRAPTANTHNLTCGFQRLQNLFMYIGCVPPGRGVRGTKQNGDTLLFIPSRICLLEPGAKDAESPNKQNPKASNPEAVKQWSGLGVGEISPDW